MIMPVNGNRTTKENPFFTLYCNDKSNGQYFNEFASFRRQKHRCQQVILEKKTKVPQTNWKKELVNFRLKVECFLDNLI